MDLFVATWTLRIAVASALAVGFFSYQSGAGLMDCVDRALAAAVAFTLAGRFVLGWLEPPEVKMMRMRKKREARRKKRPAAARSTRATPADRAANRARAQSTISRSA